ncbi:MAG: hypothetical protein JXJ19_04175 [Elusimicrobia bacterium]|nr:hypothetical protein [Elusimicrobiota bacterium]
MKNYIKKYILVSLFFMIAGCSVYEPIGIVPDHIQTVRIEPFRNQTQQVRLSTDLTDLVVDKFIKEGRLSVVDTQNADSTLIGTIIEYTKMPIAYDENFVAQEYQLTMIVNLKYNDNIQKLKMWEDKKEGLSGGMEAWVKYYVGQDPVIAETEEEARQRLLEDLSTKILHRTLYGWD